MDETLSLILIVAAIVLVFVLAVYLAPLLIPIAGALWLFNSGRKLNRDERVPLFMACIGIIAVAPSIYLSEDMGGLHWKYLLFWMLVIGVTAGVWLLNHPYFRIRREVNELIACRLKLPMLQPDAFEADIERRLNAINMNQLERTAVSILAPKVYRGDFHDDIHLVVPEFDIWYDIDEYKAANAAIEIWGRVINNLEIIQNLTIDVCLMSWRQFERHVVGDSPGPFRMNSLDAIDNVPAAIEDVVRPFLDAKLDVLMVGWTVRLMWLTNIQTASERLPTRQREEGAQLLPSNFRGTPNEIVATYLRGIPLRGLFDLDLPFGIPDSIRPEHGYIVGRSGGGKSQLIEALVHADLSLEDPPSIIVIDSKGGETGLVEHIARHFAFSPDTGRLRDRLIIIDPADKPALNMFSVDDVESEAAEAIESLRYFMGGLLGNALSGQMDMLFSPLMHIMLRMEGATLSDFRRMVGRFDPRIEPYRDILPKIPRGAREFMEDHYNDRENTYAGTKAGIVSRVSQIVNEGPLDDLFGAATNTFNMRRAIDSGSVVLIQTGNLGPTYGPMFGRYFVAQLYAAATARRTRSKRVHLYIDEAEQYIDTNFGKVFNQLRSYNVGATVAFQNAGQMGTLSQTIRSSTSFQFVGSVTQEDARSFAGDMDVSSDFIMQQRVGANTRPSFVPFACKHSGIPRAVALRVPTGLMERNTMSEALYRKLRSVNRLRMSGGMLRIESEERQHAVVGPLWSRFEAAVKGAGGVTETGALDIERLKGKLTEDQIGKAHVVRWQRNDLMHHPSEPIPDLQRWEAECRNIIAVLSDTGVSPSPSDEPPPPAPVAGPRSAVATRGNRSPPIDPDNVDITPR